jgi:hypothetical protein
MAPRVPVEEPPDAQAFVPALLRFGDGRKAVVGREGDDHGPLRMKAIERLEHAAELHVEPPKRVQVLLGFIPIAVGDHVLRREG